MLCVVFGVVILGNNMKSDQSVAGRWRTEDLLLCFLTTAWEEGQIVICLVLGSRCILVVGFWIIHLSEVEMFFCAFSIDTVNQFSLKLESGHVLNHMFFQISLLWGQKGNLKNNLEELESIWTNDFISFNEANWQSWAKDNLKYKSSF